jgi:hypothetical protein
MNSPSHANSGVSDGALQREADERRQGRVRMELNSGPEGSSRGAKDLVTITTMMGARNIDFSIKCLETIFRFCAHDIELLVHEDGTLGDEERGKLVDVLGRVRFQDRRKSDEIMAELLARYPRCHRYRQRQIMAMQVLDIPLLAAAGKRVVYTDTDILYTRPIECAAFFLGGRWPCTASQDIRESYSVHLKDWGLLKRCGVQLRSRLCAGMISYDQAVVDLDYLEWLFKLDETYGFFAGYPFFIPQTLFAALAGRVKTAWVEPRECVLAHQTNLRLVRAASIIHFAGYSRNFFPEIYAQIEPQASTWEAKQLEVVEAPNCGLGRRMWSAAKSRFFMRENATGVR